MMLKEKNVLLKCIEMQDLHEFSFKSSFFLIIFIILCVDFGKNSE